MLYLFNWQPEVDIEIGRGTPRKIWSTSHQVSFYLIKGENENNLTLFLFLWKTVRWSLQGIIFT